MSGGSMDYAYFKIEEYANDLMDTELTDLALDMAKIFKAAEWWQSGDTEEESYRHDVRNFKEKWFSAVRKDRLKAYVDKIFQEAKGECLKLIDTE